VVASQVVAVTGVSGVLGQRLLPLLDASPRVERVIGLDVRDPARRARKLEFHRIDVIGTDLAPYLRNVGVVVHLAAVLGPLPDESLYRRVNLDGTRHVLGAASVAGVHKIVRPSSVAVYGAWENNPVPLTEDAPLRPSPGYLPAIIDAECERLLVAWAAAQAGRVATRLRIAPVLGSGADSLLAHVATGRFPVRVRGAAAPVQVVHVDDAAAALELATTQDLDGAYNVAADGWLTAPEARALAGAPARPPMPLELAARTLASTWSVGLGDAPASVLPYLRYSTVVANDRLKLTGWKATHPNDETILLAPDTGARRVVPWLIGAGAVTAGVVLGAWWLTRRSRAAR